jgi:hypothetical protein
MARQTPTTTTRYSAHPRREKVRDVRASWRVIKFSLSSFNPSFPGWPRFLGSTVLPERPFVNRKARRRCGWEQGERRGPSRVRPGCSDRLYRPLAHGSPLGAGGSVVRSGRRQGRRGWGRFERSQLFAALRFNQTATDRFHGTLAGSRSEFPAPNNTLAAGMMSQAGGCGGYRHIQGRLPCP